MDSQNIPVHQLSPTLLYYNGFDISYMIENLKILLGMEYILYVKTQNFHWNITGSSFISVHKELGKQYEQLGLFIDQIAEQIRKYGKSAPGSLQEFLTIGQKNGNIKEKIGRPIKQVDVFTELLIDHESVISYINRLDTDRIDLATQNMLGTILDFHMKTAWIWRVHLE